MEPFNNAWHPSKNKYAAEWWYFTLFDKQGFVISGALTFQGAYQKNLAGEFWLSIYHPEKRPVEIHRTKVRNIKASTTSCSVKIDKNTFYEKNGRYYLQIDEPGIKMNVSGRPLVKWEDNVIQQKAGTGRIKWIIPVLRGEFTGEMTINNKKQALSGILFHDHVLVDVKPSLNFLFNFKGWLWGLIYKESESVLYVKADGKYPFNFMCYEKKGKAAKVQGSIAVTPDLKQIFLTTEVGDFVSNLDKIQRVPYYLGRSKLLKFFFDRILKIRKYHAYHSSKKEYMECLVFR